MRIHRLTIQNFLSIGPEQVIDFEMLRGLVFVEGINLDDPKAESNGAGKSAFMEAIVWVLTGKTIRGLKADEVINRRTGKDCYGILEGETGGHTWEVQRWRRHNKTTGLSLRVDDVDLTPAGDPREAQRLIDHHVGTTFDLFVNTVVFGQGAKWRFTELTDAARKELFDQMLGLGALARAREIVKAKAIEFRDMRDEQRSIVDDRATLIERNTETIEDLKEEAKREKEEKVAELEAKLVEVRADIIDMKKRVSSQDDLDHRLKVTLSNIDRYRDETVKLKASQALSGDRRAEAKAEFTLADRVLRERYAELEHAMALDPTVECDECGAKVTPTSKDAFVLKRRLRYDKAADDMKKKRKVFDDADHAKEELAKKVSEAMDKLGTEVERGHELEEAIKDRGQLQAAIARAREMRADLKAELKATKLRRPGVGHKVIDKLQAEIDKAHTTSANAAAKAERLDIEAQHYEFWVEGFGNAGVKSHLLDHVTPVLNKRAHQVSKTLMGGLVVEFETEQQLKSGAVRDKFDVSVHNPHGADVYAGNSGGEKRKIDIVVARALQSIEEDRASPCNIAWWDEVFESLDERSCEAVMAMLREEAERRETVLVVSHLEWLKPHFPVVMRVVKQGGFSRVEWP